MAMIYKSVAVVVPTYNVIKYIGECFESIDRQTFQNVKIFFVDDGSTDGTYEFLSSLVVGRDDVCLVRNSHSGVGCARNTALNEIEKRGGVDFILFLDSDDLLTKECIRNAVVSCEEYGADICTFALVPFDKKGTMRSRLKRERFLLSGGEIASFYWDADNKFNDAVESKTKCLCNRLFRASLVKGLRFEEDVRTGEDQIYIIRAFLRAKAMVVDNFCGYKYRMRKSSATHIARTPKDYRSFYFCLKSLARKLSHAPSGSNLFLEGIVSEMVFVLWVFSLSMVGNCVKNECEKRKWLTVEAQYISAEYKDVLNFKDKRRLLLLRFPSFVFNRLYDKRVSRARLNMFVRKKHCFD